MADGAPHALPDATLARLRAITADLATGGAKDESAGLADARYQIRSLLGQGGMGAVYSCWDDVLEREVAMKVALAPPGPGSRALVERLRTEARVLARLEHAGIVPVHDAGMLPDGRVFYVMKRVAGRTLAAALADPAAPLSLARRLELVQRVAEAVAFAHEHGVVHRDLSPSNVMVGEYGEVLVMDWGVAKLLADASPQTRADTDPAYSRDDEAPTVPGLAASSGDAATAVTSPGTVIGTPGYMAPEQARGDGALVDRRADVYALGALLQLAVGTDCPPPVRSIIARCQASDPARRYPHAGAVVDELRRHQGGERVEAHPEGPAARVARQLRPWRVPIALMTAYLVMRFLVALLGTR